MSTTKTCREIVKELHAAHEKLLVAQDEHASAKTAEDAARMNETSAMNRLRDAQKAVDRLTEELKRQAPYNSEWAEQRTRGTRVPA